MDDLHIDLDVLGVEPEGEYGRFRVRNFEVPKD
jgi:hypothetical protein